MKNEQTNLTTKEFLTLYTGVSFGREDIFSAVNKIFGVTPRSLLAAWDYSEQFTDYINNNRPDLKTAVEKVGVFDSTNMERDAVLPALKVWLSEMEKVLGAEIEVDKIPSKDESQPSSL